MGEIGAWIVLVILGVGAVACVWFIQGPSQPSGEPDPSVDAWLRTKRRLSSVARRRIARANRRGSATTPELAGPASLSAEASIALLDSASARRRPPMLNAKVRIGIGLVLGLYVGLNFAVGRDWHAALAIGLGLFGAISDLTERSRHTRRRARLARSYALNHALARQHERTQPAQAGR